MTIPAGNDAAKRLIAQRYTSPRALARMAAGNCPECGEPVEEHGGRGGWNCSLTDNGVAARVEQYRRDQSE